MLTTKSYLLALRAADDRRYSEVNEARAEAVRVKEAAQAQALDLARREQEYKDERNSLLRDQFGSMAGSFVTKTELSDALENLTTEFKKLIDPLITSAAMQIGRSKGVSMSLGTMVTIIMTVAAFVGILGYFFNR